MIKHVVVWKLKEENKAENAKKLKEMLDALPPIISEIKSFQVGINENDGDHDAILISEFESYEALKAYDGHPEHQKCRTFIRSVAESRVAVDFTE